MSERPALQLIQGGKAKDNQNGPTTRPVTLPRSKRCVIVGTLSVIYAVDVWCSLQATYHDVMRDCMAHNQMAGAINCTYNAFPYFAISASLFTLLTVAAITMVFAALTPVAYYWLGANEELRARRVQQAWFAGCGSLMVALAVIIGGALSG